MKKNTFGLSLIFFLIIHSSLYSQGATVTVQDLQYTKGGQTTSITSCSGIIDLNSSNSATVNLGVNLSMSSSAAVGTGTVKVFIKKSDSDFEQEKASVTIPSTSWTGGNPSTASVTPPNFSINASDINVSGSNLYVKFFNSSNTELGTSCVYQIKKVQTPTYTLNTNSIQLACGNVSTYTITVTNVYNTPNTTYSWSANGWLNNQSPSTTFTASNTVSFTPASGTTIPSNITVTPIVGGISQPSKTCTITRSPIQAVGSLIGSNTLCSNGNYTFTGAENSSTITWTLSNSSIATMNTSTGSVVELNKIGEGLVTLTATIKNICNQTYTKSIEIFSGLPSTPTLLSSSGYPYSMYNLPMNCDTNTTWLFSSNNTQQRSTQLLFTYFTTRGPATYVYKNLNQYGYATITASELALTTGNTRIVQVQAVNSCGPGPGISVTLYKPTQCQCGIGLGCNVGRIGYYPDEVNTDESTPLIEAIRTYPNPVTDVVNIEINVEVLSSNPTLYIYNILGQQQKLFNIKEAQTSINIQDLQAGVYILKIDYNGFSETHKILKQ